MKPEQLLEEADRCVRCGTCLPHCPTYTLTLDEGDSPRGRIALIQALASGFINNARLHQHLDRCLVCLACESACPSGVRYGHLIDAARRLHPAAAKKLRWLPLITQQPYRAWGRPLLWLYQTTGLRRLVRLLGGRQANRWDSLLPPDARQGRWRGLYPAEQETGRVGLFTGCAARISDRLALDATIRVLNRLGLSVTVPADQGCCGAMHQHLGDPAGAQAMAEGNWRAFNGKPLDAVIYIASGCGAQLVNMHQQPRGFHPPLYEISQFLLQHPWPSQARLAPLKQTVTLHTPCSLRNPLRLAACPEQLLGRIPGLRLEKLNTDGCCGGAGQYLLDQPEMADRLRQQMQKDWLKQPTDYLATSNTGCALHLGAGIRQAKAASKMVQVIELIDRSLNL